LPCCITRFGIIGSGLLELSVFAVIDKDLGRKAEVLLRAFIAAIRLEVITIELYSRDLV